RSILGGDINSSKLVTNRLLNRCHCRVIVGVPFYIQYDELNSRVVTEVAEWLRDRRSNGPRRPGIPQPAAIGFRQAATIVMHLRFRSGLKQWVRRSIRWMGIPERQVLDSDSQHTTML